MSWKQFAMKVAQSWLHRNTYSLLQPIRPGVTGNLPCGSTSLLPLLTSPVFIYTLTCAEWRDVSNDTRVSTIHSRTPEEKAKNHVMLTRKLPRKSSSTTHLPFLSSNPKILTAFRNTFSTKMKPTECPAKAKNEARKAKKEGGEKAKSKNFAFCACPNFTS